MSLASATDVWTLLEASRLFTPAQVTKLRDAHASRGHSDADGPATIAWLVKKGFLSEYQAAILKAGRTGPFFYGDYKVTDRLPPTRWPGLFRAVHVPTGHAVTLQFLSGSAATDPKAWAAVAGGAIRASAADSPALWRVYEPVDLEKFKFVVREDPSVEPLLDITAGRPMDPLEAVRIARHVALALASLHEKRILHGDVRSARVGVGPNSRIVLFFDPTRGPVGPRGAEGISADELLERANVMAPELALPGGKPSVLTDVYALGCTLFELLTGQPPFPGGSLNDKLARHAEQPIESLAAFDVPEPIEQLVTYMMAKNPQIRYQDAATVADQMRAILPGPLLDEPASPEDETRDAYRRWVEQTQKKLVTEERHRRAQSALQDRVGVTSGRGPVAPELAARAVASRASEGEATGNGGSTNRPTSKARGAGVSPMVIGATVVGLILVAVVGIGLMAAGGMFQSAPTVATTDGPNRAATDPSVTTPVDPPGVGGTTPVAATNAASATPTRTVGGVGGVDALWESPTSGQPISLEYLPVDSQLLIAMRPANLVDSAEGEALLRAIGPDGDAVRAEIERAIGLPWTRVERLIVAVIPNGADPLRIAYRVEPTLGTTVDEVMTAWGRPAAGDTAGATTYPVPGGRAMFLPDGTSYLVASPNDIESVIEQSGSPANIRREIQDLAATADGDRQITVLALTAFFGGDGRKLFAGVYDRIYDPLMAFLGDRVRAASLAVDVQDLTYAELRVAAEGNDDLEVARILKGRMAELPRRVEDYLVELNPSAYWRKLAFRMPLMVKAMHDYSRVGVDQRQAVINVALPGMAAENLLTGVELLVSTPPGGGGAAVAAVATAAKPAPPKTYDELLQRKFSIDIPQQDLNLAIAGLESEIRNDLGELPFDFGVVILGKDLETGGITRNQQVRNFTQKDQTLADILTAMLMKANPITTVTSPDETDQKLIWVVAPDPESGKPRVLITTRDGAAARNLTPPPVFQPKP